jgi:hypothetical protein
VDLVYIVREDLILYSDSMNVVYADKCVIMIFIVLHQFCVVRLPYVVLESSFPLRSIFHYNDSPITPSNLKSESICIWASRCPCCASIIPIVMFAKFPVLIMLNLTTGVDIKT